MISTVNKRTQTPLFATALVTMAILLLAISGTVASLAEATSLIMLTVFALVNLSLLYVKQKHPDPQGLIVFPWIVPLLGFVVSAAFIVSEFLGLVNA
jgi:amino acid transporter